MARQQIDTTTNHGTYIGDPAKSAFGKVNDMTAEIYGWAGTGGLAKLIGGNEFTGAQIIQGSLTVNGTCTSTGFRAGGSGVAPSSDGAANCGNGSQRWGTVFATSGTINTSDAREKEPVQNLSDSEIKAGLDVAAELGRFRFLPDTVAYRVEPRQHIGMTVQRLIEIFNEHGLDAMEYAMVSHDKWDATPAVWHVTPAQFDAEGQMLSPESSVLLAPEQPAGDRFGFRMDQLVAFVCRALSQKVHSLESRLERLEAALP